MTRLTPFALLTSLLFVNAACVTQEKSANFLSPLVAGPIPSTSITAPTPVQPEQGSTIVVNQQPITLALANATSSGVRPLSYAFEVATDANFSNMVFVRQGVEPGGGGQTTLRLPDALQSGRSYYWRGRAEDGANVGPYSYPVVFNIANFIGKPAAIAPSGAIDTITPEFVIGNAPRSGNVGQITYLIEVAETETFARAVAIWTVREEGGRTELEAPGAVPANKRLFWRVRGGDASTGSEWSNVLSFTTPDIAPPPTPGGGGDPGAPCGPPFPNEPLGIVQCHRSKFPGHMSSDQHIALLKGVARDLNKSGIGGGPYGILRKEAGNNCGGFSCDIICAGQGGSQRQYDVVTDHGVTWGQVRPPIREDQCVIQ